VVVLFRGGDLGGQEGIVPLKYLGGGDGGAFNYSRKCPNVLKMSFNAICNCNSERD